MISAIRSNSGLHCSHNNTAITQPQKSPCCVSFNSLSAYPSMDVFLKSAKQPSKPDKTSVSVVNNSEAEELAQKYPIDHKYRTELAKEAGCDVSALRSVIGIQELGDILKNSKSEDFSSGNNKINIFDERYKNVLNGKFKINLHIHSVYSDGKMTTSELLDQAVKYAEKTNQVFTFGLTDHEALEGDKEIISTIAANPEKYKNIRFVPGIEFESSYNHPSFKSPILVDMLGYCINPYDKNLQQLLDLTAKNRLKEGEDIIKTANKVGIDASMQEANSINPRFNSGRCVVYFQYLNKYLERKANQQGKSEYLPQFVKLIDEKQISSAMAMASLIKTVKNSGCGQVGIAHPARVDCSQNLKDGIKVDDSTYQAINRQYIDETAKLGASMIETNYQYVSKKYFGNVQNPEKWINNTNNYCKKLSSIETGGIDCHENNIFSYKDNLNPDQINKLTEVLYPEVN